MTERPRRSYTPQHPRIKAAAVLTTLTLAIAALAPAVLAGGTTTVVTTIPGGGWVQSLDNTAGGSAQLVAFAEPGTLGNGALQLTTAAMTDFAGVAHPFAVAGIPASDVTAASWRTFVVGDTGNPDTEAAALRFTGYQNGLSNFTTLVVELVYNGGVTEDVWQDNTLSDETVVWQTTNSGDDFCLDTVFCTFAEYKAQYPNARFIGTQVAIGTGVPAVTTYADGVSLTIDGITETFDFDVAAAAPTPAPTVPPPNEPTPVPATGGGDLPDTATTAQPDTAGLALGSIVVLSAVATAFIWRRRPIR